MIYILIPIILVACIPFQLILFGLSQKISPGNRFKCTVLLTLLCWVCLGWYYSDQISLSEWIVGCLFLASAFIGTFMIWSVLCWGYTISMLLCLFKNNKVNHIQQWEELYAGTDGTLGLTSNRTKVLIWLKCIDLEIDHIKMTKWGHVMAAFWGRIYKSLGIKN